MNVVIVAPESGRFQKNKAAIEAEYEKEGYKCFLYSGRLVTYTI